ncbi:hypothetical protein J3459_007878 [Metarhizium acridum]|uniref:uncharacterized protein n=1 Tax=Metarhizium acridum TaxID=92637 RepID=UPI001C6BF3C3|nr:hypothetical protein J3458_019021 [Metarhizium acridum]KAG8426673.1 hypothetical protein J3459_007916 [Metarhizium acridum]KAG8426702.1 hypothetical protein J3459_007878 [Metarhizium acridum]
MSKTRLAPALQVFQTLQRYPVIRPRRLPDVPIGCASRVSAQAARQSMLSLYHDLGVLVFAGCSAAQTERIGDILRQVVRWGGPGGAVTRLSWTAVDGPERVDGLTAEDFHEGPDEANAGRIKPDAILKLASCRLQQLLRKQVDRAPGQGRAHLQEVQVVVPGLPAPRGTILPAETGPRQLQVVSYAMVGVDGDGGHATGEMSLFTVGTGDYVGSARIDYRLVQSDEGGGRAVPLLGHGGLGKRSGLGTQGLEERLDEATGLLEKLWELEREVWAHRAAEYE